MIIDFGPCTAALGERQSRRSEVPVGGERTTEDVDVVISNLTTRVEAFVNDEPFLIDLGEEYRLKYATPWPAVSGT